MRVEWCVVGMRRRDVQERWLYLICTGCDWLWDTTLTAWNAGRDDKRGPRDGSDQNSQETCPAQHDRADWVFSATIPTDAPMQ